MVLLNKNSILTLITWCSFIFLSYFYKNNLFLLAPLLLLIINEFLYIYFNIDVFDGPSRTQLFYDITTTYFIKNAKNNTNLTILTNTYLEKEKWLGCFGIMSVITYDFLNILVDKYNIFSLLNVVKTREDRCSLERIFSILCYVNNNYFTDVHSPSIFGEIVEYKFLGMPFHYNYNNYLTDKKTFDVSKFSKIIKVWCGR